MSGDYSQWDAQDIIEKLDLIIERLREIKQIQESDDHNEERGIIERVRALKTEVDQILPSEVIVYIKELIQWKKRFMGNKAFRERIERLVHEDMSSCNKEGHEG